MRKSNITSAVNQYHIISLMIMLLLPVSSMKIIRLMIFPHCISIPFYY